MKHLKGWKGVLAILICVYGCFGNEGISHSAAWQIKPFPIGGWKGPSPTDEAFQRYKSADFTMVIASNEDEIKLAKQYGLAAFIAHNRMTRRHFTQQGLREVMSMADRYDNVKGYLIWDEPSPKFFQEISRWTDALGRAHPEHLAWINLHPVKLIEEELPGVTSYERYIEDFIAMVGPRMISYDNYGALRESNDDRFFYKNFEDSYFFYNMKIIRDTALKHDLPFWGFVLSTPHWAYVTPTEADLRFQVYSLLAYGADGVWYFTYRSVENLSRKSEELARATGIDSGLIGHDSDKSDRYEMVKEINAEILALGPTLLRLTSKGVYHLDEPKLPRQYYLEDPKDVPELKCEALPGGGYVQSVSGGRPLVGLFQDVSGDDYFMIVNKKRREMDIVTRIALGEDRHRVELEVGGTLGQKFHADSPISAVSILASSYSGVGHGATIRLKKGGPQGKVAAVWAWHNLFANNAVIMRFPTQPPGEYYIELSEVRGKTGWWSKRAQDGRGAAFVDGLPVPGEERNFIAYAEPDLSPDRIELTFNPESVLLEEVSKEDGRLIRRDVGENGKITFLLGQGDGRLFKISVTEPHKQR